MNRRHPQELPEPIYWLEPTGVMTPLNGLAAVAGAFTAVFALLFIEPPQKFLCAGLGLALFIGALLFYFFFHRSKSYITWDDKEIRKVVVSGLDKPWTLPWADLKTVKWITSPSTILIFRHSQTLPIKWKNMPLEAQILIGEHLIDTEETEIARPFLSFDIDPKIIRKNEIIRAVLVILGVLTGLFPFVGPRISFLSTDVIALSLLLFYAAYETHKKLKRARLAARLPRLLDQNRDLELEIYEEFGEHAQAAARFYRHIWSHRPANAFQLLPLPTQKRLLKEAKNSHSLKTK